MKIDNTPCSDRATRLLAEYIQDKGIAISALSKGTGITYGKLQRSLNNGERAFRTDEYLAICSFLELSPMKFYQPVQQGGIVGNTPHT